jgi:ubiquinone/menaquinone biosynthesis C-methylase UbiE
LLQQCDAKQLPFSAGAFDAVVSNSIVHHIASPQACLKQAIRAVQPGGLLFFRDLLRPSEEQELARVVELYAPQAGLSRGLDHQRQMFADSLHAALTLDEVRTLVAQLGFPPEMVQATSDRHWTWTAKNTAAHKDFRPRLQNT